MQTCARPKDTWSDLRALGYEQLIPMAHRSRGNNCSDETPSRSDAQAAVGICAVSCGSDASGCGGGSSSQDGGCGTLEQDAPEALDELLARELQLNEDAKLARAAPPPLSRQG